MGRRKLDARTVTLNSDLRGALAAVCLEQPGIFWRKFLAATLTRYQFQAAYDGGEVSSESAQQIEEAYLVAVEALIRACDPVTDWGKVLTGDLEVRP